MTDAIPVPPEAEPQRPEFASWPEEARIAALAAVDYRALHGRLDISANEAWLLVADILNAVTPFIAAAGRERILALLDTWRCSCGEDDCAAYDTRDQIASLIGDAR